MARTHARTILLGAAVVLAAIAVAVTGAAGADIVAVDEDTALTETETIDAYDAEGVATATVAAPDLTITIAEKSGDVGLDGWHFDGDSRYLRLQYHEDIPRKIRFFVPAEYWHPVSHQTDSMDGETEVTMRPTEDGRYTAVTVSFDGQTDAVVDLPKATNFVFWSREGLRDAANETVGYEAPRLSTGGEWEYVSDADFGGGNTSVAIDDSDGSTIQYDASGANESEQWVSVPRCSRGSAAVCTYRVDGQPDTVMVLSTTQDPPAVRYKTGSDPVAQGKSWGQEIWNAPQDFLNDIRGIFGGDGGGSGGDDG